MTEKQLTTTGLRTSDNTIQVLKIIAALTNKKYEQILNELLNAELINLKEQGKF